LTSYNSYTMLRSMSEQVPARWPEFGEGKNRDLAEVMRSILYAWEISPLDALLVDPEPQLWQGFRAAPERTKRAVAKPLQELLVSSKALTEGLRQSLQAVGGSFSIQKIENEALWYINWPGRYGQRIIIDGGMSFGKEVKKEHSIIKFEFPYNRLEIDTLQILLYEGRLHFGDRALPQSGSNHLSIYGLTRGGIYSYLSAGSMLDVRRNEEGEEIRL
jgi:hypothetical protein